MDVLLDSNIYYGQYYFDSMSFKSLFAYLGNKKSKLLLPEVVRDEVLDNYSEILEKFHSTQKSLQSYSNVLFRPPQDINQPPNEALKKYKLSLKKVIKTLPIRMINSDEINLSLVSSRCEAKIHPFGQNEKYPEIGFKDTIIWLCLLNQLSKSDEIFFISNDKVAFGETSLTPELQSEIDQLPGKRVFYFNSLEKFLSENYFDLKAKINKANLITFSSKWQVTEFIVDGMANEIENNQGLAKLIGDEYNFKNIWIPEIKFTDFDIFNYENEIAYIRLTLEALVEVNFVDKVPKTGRLGIMAYYRAIVTIDVAYSTSKVKVIAVDNSDIKIIKDSYKFVNAKHSPADIEKDWGIKTFKRYQTRYF
jgi:hypothetical protein